MVRQQLANRSIILMPWMPSQQPLHSNSASVKKGKWLFFAPPTRKESWENSSNCLTTHSLALGQHSIMVFQSTDNLPKCNNANLEQFLWEVRTTGRQRQSSHRVLLWKGMVALFLLMHLFPCMWNLLKGNAILFPAKSLIQLLGPIPIFKQSSLCQLALHPFPKLLQVKLEFPFWTL